MVGIRRRGLEFGVASTDAAGAGRRDGAVAAAVSALFFVSGFSALVYQTAWQRLLGMFGGADTVAAALVVGAFLLGLGLGSLWASAFADGLSRRRAYALFGLVEIGVGLFGAVSVFLFYDVLFQRFVGVAQSHAAVFAVAFAGLMWPTVLMGLSLPLLARALVRDVATSAATVSGLYAVNTLGAAVGAFAAGWWMLGAYGYEATVWTAAAMNVLVGAGALAVAAAEPPAPRAAGPGNVDRTAARPFASVPPAVWRWCALVFVSGFLIICLQIVWYRLLGILTQSSAYGFSLVLGTFLAGDAAGLVAGAALARRLADPRRFFLWMQGAVVLASALVVWAVYLAFGLEAVSDVFVDGFVVEPVAWKLAVVFGLTALVVLPGSVIIGMSFPLVQKAIQTDPDLVGQRVGLIQLANIGGNSLGGLVGGLVLLHLFGTAGTIRIVLLLGLGFLALLWLSDAGARRAGNAALAGGIALALVLFPSGEAFWAKLHGEPADDGRPALVEEDRSGVVVLREGPDGRDRLYIGGHSQSCIPFCAFHGYLGLLGPLVHDRPEDVLVIGVGSGGTPYGAGIREETRHVRAIEIVAPVYEVLDRWVEAGGRHGIDGLFRDPRFEFDVGDGRHALFTDDRLWDVIEADAVLPQSAHSGMLYSVEYYEQVRRSLAPGGIAVKWGPTDRSLASFLAVFPHAVVKGSAMIGSDRPVDVSDERLKARLAEPRVAAYLAAAGLDAAEYARWIDDAVPRVYGPEDPRPAMEVNTDLRPRDEFYLNNGLTFTR